MNNENDGFFHNEKNDVTENDKDFAEKREPRESDEPARSYEVLTRQETAEAADTGDGNASTETEGSTISQGVEETEGSEPEAARGEEGFDRDPYSYHSVHGHEAGGTSQSEDHGSPSRGYWTPPRDGDTLADQRDRKEQQTKRSKGLFGTLAMVLVGAILGSAITMGTGWVINGNKQTPVVQYQAGNSDSSERLSSIVTAPAADIETTAENLIAENVTPSVVGITTQTRVTSSNENPFSFGFQNSDTVVQGVGSGVIISADGYILTNSHVVSDGEAEKIQVIFSDETAVAGEVLWNDSTLDLAIVKVQAEGLTPVEIASSDLVRVGDKAIAIGNPLGMDLQSTLTSGVISGLDRSISLSDGSNMSGLIQTDAAINEGNSGGALLNAAGQLIGINTAKAGGSTSGIGFAIPIDTAKVIIEKVMTEGSFQSVYLGVAGVDTQTVRTMGGELSYEGDGVYIMEIMAGTAADEAGLEVNDIITEINGTAINGMTALKEILLNYTVGDTVEVTIVRGSSEKNLELTFAQDSSNIDEYNTSPDTTTMP